MAAGMLLAGVLMVASPLAYLRVLRRIPGLRSRQPGLPLSSLSNSQHRVIGIIFVLLGAWMLIHLGKPLKESPYLGMPPY